jgi:hypothetical protein
MIPEKENNDDSSGKNSNGPIFIAKGDGLGWKPVMGLLTGAG